MENFYKDLPSLNEFKQVATSKVYTPIPKEWIIIITDIKNSTPAIEAGRYKDVNLIGALCIAAILNIDKSMQVPFVFGGDGATLLIPPSLKERASSALTYTKNMAKKEFDLDLRIGMVNVNEVYNENISVDIAKIEVSLNYYQASFTGGGLSYAEALVKNNPTKYDIISTLTEANYDGLECRWQDIPTSKNATLSIIIQVLDNKSEELYLNIFETIEKLFGTKKERSPVSTSVLHLTYSLKKLFKETKARTFNKSTKERYNYLGTIWLLNVLGAFLMQFKIKLGEMPWGRYKSIISETTDFEKFDDMLRMVIVSDTNAHIKFENYLEALYKEKKISYGIHSCDRALMTCLIGSRHGTQVHFVDGAEGGYTMAAKAFKKRLKTLS